MTIETTINGGLPMVASGQRFKPFGADYNTDLIWDTHENQLSNPDTSGYVKGRNLR